MMKKILCFLLGIALLLPGMALGAADTSSYRNAEEMVALSKEECTETLPLREGTNTITAPGAYLVQGKIQGQLIIDAEDADVYLLLDGVSITSPDGPALHVKAAHEVFITLAEGTVSTLTDSAAYTLPDGEDEPDGALFSKADLALNGEGTLQVVGQYNDGIVSKDSLTIASACVQVESVGDGIRGKDSLTVYRATLNVTAGQDGLKSTNDKDSSKGWVSLMESDITIQSANDGVQAETELTVNGGMMTIVSGGGCQAEYRQELAAPVRKGDAAQLEDEVEEEDEDAPSTKGLKATNIDIIDGTFIISSRDDAIHANGSITLEGGSFTLSSNDDAIHADDNFTILDGDVLITECYEGIEASHMTFAGGRTDVTAIDDGWNAANKAAAEAESGRKKKNHDFSLTVSGGEHTILAGGDAIDSNGDMLFSGGITLAASSNTLKEVPIDYPEVCSCKVAGGILAATGAYGKNTQNVNQTEGQASVLIKWKEEQAAGTLISLSMEGKTLFTLSPKANFKCLIFSAPDVQTGSSLTVALGDEEGSTRKIGEAICFFPVGSGSGTGSAGGKSNAAGNNGSAGGSGNAAGNNGSESKDSTGSTESTGSAENTGNAGGKSSKKRKGTQTESALSVPTDLVLETVTPAPAETEEANYVSLTARPRKTQAAAVTTAAPAQSEDVATAYGTMTAHPAGKNALGYWLYVPDGAGSQPLPLIVYLHGGSGKGSDLSLITGTAGFPQYLQQGQLGDVQAYVLCPQCPADQSGWRALSKQVFTLMDQISATYPVNKDKIILTGHSMGGTGTWALAALAPERFSCIIPMSGSTKVSDRNKEALSTLSVWAFAGEKDKVVDPASSTNLIALLQEVNPNAKLTLFPDAEHRDVPGLAWLDTSLGLMNWALAQ